MAQIIPLTNAPVQTLSVSLNVDGQTLRLRLTVKFNEMAQYWTLDIADGSGNPLLASLPLLTGNWPAANILAQYSYMQIGSVFVINLGVDSDYPDASNLGTGFNLLWDNTA